MFAIGGRWTRLALAVIVASITTASASLAQNQPTVRSSGPGRFYLSWNAPWGQPRAREVLDVACRDTTRSDTLYLTFDPGQDTTLVAVDAELRLWPAEGDTLARHWWFESRSNPAHLLADFNMPEVRGADRIWETMGTGGVRTVSRPDTAFIRVVWAVREAEAAPIRRGRQYAFCRLVFPRPRVRATCAKPLCVELNFARLAFNIRSTEVVRQGRRWVSWNPGGTTPCAERVRLSRVQPWRGVPRR